ncbi:large ribosomal subunit protein mL37-like isoform X2 [Littorina saxatilis]|uniref:Large ribosomal subunit protein mL37 n=1 Tax=Littorina saxatilis TaxID=31220 RepID=A0AAN9BHL9_9CAEN
MKWTAVLCKRSLAFGWRSAWGSKKLQYPDYPPRIPKALIDKGVEFVDPQKEEEREVWRPPVNDSRFYVPPKKQELWNYNEEPAFVCTPRICIHQGVKQAASLAKAQVFEGLPPSVNRLVDTVDIDETIELVLQRSIMQAQYWNPTKEKLPKRIDPRKPGWKFQAKYGIPAKLQAGILARNLLRLCQSQVTAYPSLAERRHIHSPYINSHFLYRDEPVVVRGLGEWLITSNQPLPRFGDEDTVDASVNHALPDLYPLLPTIDLIQDHNYTLEHNLGMKTDWSHGQLHTLLLTDANHYKTDHRLGRDILFCLGHAVAQARHKYGDVTTLPEPVCVQSVSMDHQTLNFVCFQLNTLATDTDNGVKNLVWVDGGNNLYHKILGQPWMPKAIRFERLEDFNPTVFQKLMALYLNGASELKSVR